MASIMNEDSCIIVASPDSAAVFAAAFSLWNTCREVERLDPELALGDHYNGLDQLMREIMSVANRFEIWACSHIVFEETDECWPFLLQHRFGEACLAVASPKSLADFGERDALRVAVCLGLPVRIRDGLRMPVDVTSRNPVSGSAFREWRIQTVRDLLDDEDTEPYVAGHDPFDPEYGVPYFALYGVRDDKLLEHIADRSTYDQVVKLASDLAPGVVFPSCMNFSAVSRSNR
jgi:hypothetical protein